MATTQTIIFFYKIEEDYKCQWIVIPSEKWPGDQEGEEEKDVAFVLLLKNVE